MWTGPHGAAMLSVDQLPVGYSGSMTAMQTVPWSEDAGRMYRCVGRSRSPPFAVSRGRLGGSRSLPSPPGDGVVAAASLNVPTSSVYHVDSYTSPLHANLALKVETDTGSYSQLLYVGPG